MLCDIIIPVWNQPAFTKDCVDSIRKNTYIDYRLILVDNASEPETRDYLRTLAGPDPASVLLIRNEENLGFIKAVNQAIAVSKTTTPFVCILNNDTIVTKDWLKIMIDVARAEGDIGIVNPSSNNLGQRPKEGEPVELYAQKLSSEIGRSVELGACIGFCMLIKREVIDRIGTFDEIYGMGNFEDTDFSRRAINQGYRCVRACGAYVYHRENSSFNRVDTFEDDFRRNREIFEFRWGKPKRFAYIVTRHDDNLLKRLRLEATKLARGGNWVWYISKDPIDIPDHSNIRLVRLDGGWFYARAAFEILKKKKRFDEIFVGDGKMGAILNRMDFIHRAKVSYY